MDEEYTCRRYAGGVSDGSISCLMTRSTTCGTMLGSSYNGTEHCPQVSGQCFFEMDCVHVPSSLFSETH